jgi:hypothetical protein
MTRRLDPKVKAARLESRRPRLRETFKRLLADPVYCQKQSWLNQDERKRVVDEIQAGRCYQEIADRWLITHSWVRKIAYRHGIYKPKGPPAFSMPGNALKKLLADVRRGHSNYTDLAKKYRIPYSQVGKLALAHGIKQRHPAWFKRLSPERYHDLIKRLRSDETFESIGKRFGKTRLQINKFALANNIRRSDKQRAVGIRHGIMRRASAR